jgi:3-isopropylmalate dehydratase small subunit
MRITDPTPLIDKIDQDQLQDLLRTDLGVKPVIQYIEPSTWDTPTAKPPIGSSTEAHPESPSISEVPTTQPQQQHTSTTVIAGKVQHLGDFIDTDALAPAEALIGNLSNEELGKFCLVHTHPEFRQRVKDGLNIVVAGKAFGVGSSRENAVTALMGTGVQCVIARSFAFIYARNQPNMGLLGIVMEDEAFYEVTNDGIEIEIRVDERVMIVNGKQFRFTLSDLEVRLWKQGGISPAFAKWGKKILEQVTAPSTKSSVPKTLETSVGEQQLEW